MAYNAQILLGRIIKVHGYEGAVAVKLEKAFLEETPEHESVFLEIEGKPVPFFISSLENPGGGVLWIKFMDYESIEKAREFTGCRIFLTSQGPDSHYETDIMALEGYEVRSGDNSIIGKISGVLENPGQILLSVITGEGKEILVPFHEDLILKADHKRKIISIDLPEGLMELND